MNQRNTHLGRVPQTNTLMTSILSDKNVALSVVYGVDHLIWNNSSDSWEGNNSVSTPDRDTTPSSYIVLLVPFLNTECTHLNDVEHRKSSVPVLSCDTVNYFPNLFGSVSKISVFLAFLLKISNLILFILCIHILDRGDKQMKWIIFNKIWSVGPIIWQLEYCFNHDDGVRLSNLLKINIVPFYKKGLHFELSLMCVYCNLFGQRVPNQFHYKKKWTSLLKHAMSIIVLATKVYFELNIQSHLML